MKLLEQRYMPYFARVDLEKSHDSKKSIDVVYIGKSALLDNKGNLIVSDWRSDIAKTYYQNTEIEFKINDVWCLVLLRRSFDIKNGELISYKNEFVYDGSLPSKYDQLLDPFLVQLIKEKRTEGKFTDIIRTIQRKQIEIIYEKYDQNIIVQGYAGSGKTMILLHRLSYLLYNNKNINPHSIWIITPNNIFNKQIKDLAHELELDLVNKGTIVDYYLEKLDNYGFKFVENIRARRKNEDEYIKAVEAYLGDEDSLPKEMLDYCYSDECLEELKNAYKQWVRDIKNYLENIGYRELMQKNNIKVGNYRFFDEALREILTNVNWLIGENEIISQKIEDVKGYKENVENLIAQTNKGIQEIEIIANKLKNKENINEKIVKKYGLKDRENINTQLLVLKDKLIKLKKRLKLYQQKLVEYQTELDNLTQRMLSKEIIYKLVKLKRLIPEYEIKDNKIYKDNFLTKVYKPLREKIFLRFGQKLTKNIFYKFDLYLILNLCCEHFGLPNKQEKLIFIKN